MDERTVRALVKKATERQKKAAKLLAQPDKTIFAALTEAGYSAAQANKGYAAVPKTVLAMLPESVHFVDLGRAITPEQQESAIRGRLFSNVIKGVDKAVNSSYRLGQDKRVNMFTAETQVGVMVINAPETSVKQLAVPEETPETPSK